MKSPKGFSQWFYAAALYNVIWGLLISLFPLVIIEWANLKGMIVAPFLQVIGMMVGVYGYGYYLMARDPVRYSGFIWIGLLGKVFGVIGFLTCALTGALPWNIGLTIIINDAIWIPAFAIFAWKHARKPV